MAKFHVTDMFGKDLGVHDGDAVIEITTGVERNRAVIEMLKVKDCGDICNLELVAGETEVEEVTEPVIDETATSDVKIMAAMKSVINRARRWDINKDGKPSVKAVEKVLGEDITEEMRDTIYEKYFAKKDDN